MAYPERMYGVDDDVRPQDEPRRLVLGQDAHAGLYAIPAHRADDLGRGR